MISFTVRMKFAEADHEVVAEMLRKLTLASRQEPGCVNYVSHFLAGDPGTVLIYEQYVDEAALEAHQNTAHFREYGSEGFYRLMRAQQIKYMDAIV
ncbi:MAG TPA: putative quinol monooxygenase [Acidobacteriaceae bacterium]|jgi:quinol monooxygenase YgiN|nr:putative quinol monooxygenase [Acidobacteriaceae bacterium]